MSLRQTIIVDASFNFTTMTTGIGLAIHETDRPPKKLNGTENSHDIGQSPNSISKNLDSPIKSGMTSE
jgi:hypothetical protein